MMTWRNLAVQGHLFKEDDNMITSPRFATVVIQYYIFVVQSRKMILAPDINMYTILFLLRRSSYCVV